MKQINNKPAKIKRAGIQRTAIYLLLLAGLSACDSIPFINNTPDYKTAGRARPQDRDPD